MATTPAASNRVVATGASPVALRPLAIPNEHGGWGFLAEPVLLGLLVAPTGAGALIGIAALAAFLSRHPLRLAAADYLRHKRYPRTGACEMLALGYASAAFVAIISAVGFAGTTLLLPLLYAAPLAILQFAFDARNRGRALAPELAGAAAMGSVAASIALAAGKPWPVALALWAVLAARAIPAILYVRAALKREHVALAVLLHLAAIAVAFALWPAAVIPMLFLLGRCIEGVVRSPRAAKVVGILELVYGAVFVAFAAFA